MYACKYKKNSGYSGPEMRHVPPARQGHAAHEQPGRAHGEEAAADRIAADEQVVAPLVQEGQHVVIEQDGNGDHAVVEKALPGQRGCRIAAAAQAEHAEVPDGERARQEGEHVVTVALAGAGQRAADEQHVEQEGQERQQLVDAHGARSQKPM